MHRSSLRLLLLMMMLFIAMALPALAQNDRPNAADDYRRAFALLERLDPADREILGNVDWNSGSFTRTEREAIMRARPAINAFREGASRAHVDFGIDYSAGPQTLLPHLGPMRQGTRLLLADARLRMIDGDVRGATDNLRSMMKLSNHSTDDPVLISTLVGTAIYSLSNTSVRQMLGEGALDQAAARDLLKTIDDIAQPDPFGLAASIEGEREAFAGWMIETYHESGDANRFMEDMGAFGMEGDGMFGLGTEIAALSPDGFRTAMDSYDEALRQVVEAAKLDDLQLAQSEMKRLMSAIEDGQFGPITMMFVPSFDRVTESVLATYGAMAELREDLAAAAESEEALKDLQNAAAWYQRAIAAMRREFGSDIAQLREWSAAEEVDFDLITPRLEAMKETREAIARAVEIRRCDFDFMSIWPSQGLRARLGHLDDMRALAAFVALDARRHRIAGAAEPAGTRLAWLVAMAEHLGQTSWPESAQTAMNTLELALGGVSSAVTAPNMPATAFAPVRRMLDRCSLKDPIGLGTLIADWPRRSTDWMLQRYRGRNAPRQFVSEMNDRARDLAEPLRAALWEETPEVFRRHLNELDAQFDTLVPFAHEHQAAAVEQEVGRQIARFDERDMTALASLVLAPLAEFARWRDEARMHIETLRVLTSSDE